jgi:superfamily II DNA or RNA helicase
VSDYRDFIAAKRRKLQPMGFDVAESQLNPSLFDWQKKVVSWALRRGRAALFEECGLGKTLQQLVWAEHVAKRTGKPVILLCPVGVRQQTKREAEKFAIDCTVEVVNHADDVVAGINLVNYEKLHLFDCSVFGGVVLDESSILKNFTSKTKRQLIAEFSRTPYRLACTATPAPNDQKELGNHAEFLGIMPSNEMLSRWFINDTMKAGGYRLKKHAMKDYWDWVASWAVCLATPADIGGDDSQYVLPDLRIDRHLVTVDPKDAPEGFLINIAGISATTIHEEKRLTCNARADKAAELANSSESCVIWCDTNYEADALRERVVDCVEVRGSDKESAREERFAAFLSGESKRIITKPEIAGLGLNWQHCNHQVFAGLSYSFEQYYQAVRRCWRFGQQRAVTVDIVLADSDSAIESAIARKEADHQLMQSGMAEAMREATLAELGIEREREIYVPTKAIELPAFLRSKEYEMP